jgi:hypothetical protein
MTRWDATPFEQFCIWSAFFDAIVALLLIHHVVTSAL